MFNLFYATDKRAAAALYIVSVKWKFHSFLGAARNS